MRSKVEDAKTMYTTGLVMLANEREFALLMLFTYT
jgi:hypothetical protein